MSKTIKFVCSSFPSPPPKWVKVRRNYQGSGYNCTAQLDSVPLQIQGLVAENRSAEALEAVGFVNPRNFLIDEEIS